MRFSNLLRKIFKDQKPIHWKRFIRDMNPFDTEKLLSPQQLGFAVAVV